MSAITSVDVRCYWALLSPELTFIYLDPFFALDLDDRAESLVGKRLLSFIHPADLSSARADLATVLNKKHLHGSVTRTRFSTLSCIRRELSASSPTSSWQDSDKTPHGENDFSTVDIVVNFAADGLVLCFIHSLPDPTRSPTDKQEHSHSDWPDSCGSPILDKSQLQFLGNRLVVCAPRPSDMSRVFQILSNDVRRELLFTWPLDHQAATLSARDYARLVENAQIGCDSNSSREKTSCTRRFKAENAPPVIAAHVESIFVPYGNVIFACHKLDSAARLTNQSPAVMQQTAYNGRTYHTQQPPAYYDSSGPAGHYILPPIALATSSYPSSYPAPPPVPPAPYPHHWPHPTEPPGPYQHWQSSPVTTAATLPTVVSSTPYLGPGPDRSVSPRRRVSPGSGRSNEPYPLSGRNSSARPTGILKCSSCKATSSPEWRKGPSGKKELCNACGLRYARSRAKKEGHVQVQRKRKDPKGIVNRDSTTPPPGSSYSPLHARSYGGPSFSAGSNSGSEIYQHSSHHVLDEKETPSPSPPSSSGMNFVHYSPATAEHRAPYGSPAQFYSAPSPLSNPPIQLGPQSQHGGTQLPPLSYVDRMSPVHPTGSPILHSPMSPKFEREREKNRELAVPLEPRSRRTIVTQP